jgi:hypothetical protein
MNLKTCLLVLLISLFGAELFSQKIQDRDLSERKGNFFVYWGYNRSNYGKSDIKLVGENYNFELSKVRAKDMPKELSSSYYQLSEFTVPQFNFRAGYYFNNKYAIALGWDHMKYQTVNGSFTHITGRIDKEVSERYAGVYYNDPITMNHDELIKMEHSDGFNVVNINIERNDLLYASKDQKLGLGLVSGLGLGLAFPWTNSFVFGKRNDDRPHFSGMGSHAYLAAEATLWKRMFLRYTAQVGFENMWDIAITPKGDNSAHAEQTIFYFERSVVLGVRFRVFGLKSSSTSE